MNRLFLILITAGFLLCQAVSAQDQRKNNSSEWELSFFAGMSSLGETSSNAPIEGTSETHASSFEPDSGILLGARITQNFDRYFSAEMDYTFSDHGGTFSNPTPTIPSLNMDQTSHSLFYNLLFHLRDSSNNLRPYAAAGVGVTYFALDDAITSATEQLGFPMKNDWELGFRVGGGAKYRLNDKIGIRIDFTDQMSDTPNFELPSVAPVNDSVIGAGYAPSGTLHNMQMSIGLIYYPGKQF